MSRKQLLSWRNYFQAIEREGDYQKWFERNPVVFVSLGYVANIPHPKIVTHDGTEYIPDFLVKKPNGTWEIFELKVPHTKILRDKNRRNTFYATFEGYLSQCHEYAECFMESVCRNFVEERYSIELLGARPSSVLVAGRNEGLDLNELNRLATRRSPPISIYTYDDIHIALLSYRAFSFGAYDKAHGVTVSALIMLHAPDKPHSKNHILDIGIHQEKDRVAIYFDPQGYLRLRVWDSDGESHEVRSNTKIEKNDFEVPLDFIFQIGIGEDFGFLSIQVDGLYHADIKIQEFPFVLNLEFVIGSDWKAAAPSWFTMSNLLVLNRVVTFEEKMEIQARNQVSVKGEHMTGMVFKGNKWMHSAGHPTSKIATQD